MASREAVAKACAALHLLYGPDRFPALDATGLGVWAAYLGEVDDEQLLAAVMGWEDEWPPSAPTLRRAARGVDPARAYAAPYHRPFALEAGERCAPPPAIRAAADALRNRSRDLCAPRGADERTEATKERKP